MTEYDTRIDASLPGQLVKQAAMQSGLFGPNDRRSTVVRYALIKLFCHDDSEALRLATGDGGGRRKRTMEPADNRIGVLIPSEYLEKAKQQLPEVKETSMLLRYALYRMRGWPHDDCLEAAKDYRYPSRKMRVA